MTVLARVLASLSIAVLLAGCGDQTASGTNEKPTEKTDDKSSAKAEGGLKPSVELMVASKEQYEKTLADHAAKNRVVLVDYWATWCIPCRKKFPKIVETAKNRAKDGLAVVTIAVEDDDKQQDALDYLKKIDARFDNFRPETGVSQATIDNFAYNGGVPFYKLYDRTGKLRYQFSPNEGEGEDRVENWAPIKSLDEKINELLSE